MRHLAPRWDVHRHRVAPQIDDLLQDARRSGRLVVVAGRVLSLADRNGTIEVSFRRRGAPAAETLQVRRVINCTGPGADVRLGSSHLLRSLIARGIGRPGPPRSGTRRRRLRRTHPPGRRRARPDLRHRPIAQGTALGNDGRARAAQPDARAGSTADRGAVGLRRGLRAVGTEEVQRLSGCRLPRRGRSQFAPDSFFPDLSAGSGARQPASIYVGES